MRPPLLRRFSSNHISLLFGGALATTGLLRISGCASDDPPPPQPTPSTTVISQDLLAWDLQQDREEENNSYVPSLGYYHALSRTWYPYPFNYYYPGWGYFRGGDWHDTPYGGEAPKRSRPDWKTVTTVQPGSGFHAGPFRAGHVGSGEGVSRGIFTAPHFSGGHAGFRGGHLS